MIFPWANIVPIWPSTELLGISRPELLPWYHPTTTVLDIIPLLFWNSHRRGFLSQLFLLSFPQAMLLMMFLLSNDILLSNKKSKIILSSTWASWSCPCCCWLWFYMITQGVFKWGEIPFLLRRFLPRLPRAVHVVVHVVLLPGSTASSLADRLK